VKVYFLIVIKIWCSGLDVKSIYNEGTPKIKVLVLPYTPYTFPTPPVMHA